MKRDGERGDVVEVRELGIPMGSLEGMSSSKRRDVSHCHRSSCGSD